MRELLGLFETLDGGRQWWYVDDPPRPQWIFPIDPPLEFSPFAKLEDLEVPTLRKRIYDLQGMHQDVNGRVYAYYRERYEV